MTLPKKITIVVVVIIALGVAYALAQPFLKGSPNKPHAPTDTATEPDTKDSPVKSVKTFGFEVTIPFTDPKTGAKTSYVARAKDVLTKVGDDGIEYGVMTDVTGEITKDGKIESKFKAPKGFADKSKQVLTLTGGVTVTGDSGQGSAPLSPENDIVMTAGQVKYDQAHGRIEATGDVTVTSGSAKMSNLPVLYATPDLRRVGTPGKFK